MVAGQTLALRTSAKDGYLKELAALVTERVDEARGSGRAVTTQSSALLAAMNIADELLRLRERHSKLKKQARTRLERILHHLDREAEFLA